jgi:hypothetical protein
VQHGPGGTVYHGQFIQDKKEGRVVISYTSGERTFDRYEAGKKVSSFFWKALFIDQNNPTSHTAGPLTGAHRNWTVKVSSDPFDGATEEHAAVLRQANMAEARRA